MAEHTRVADKRGDLRMDAAAKRALYAEVRAQVEAVLDGEADLLAAMTTLVCLLHNAFPYYYWTGFYRRVSADELLVGPYQGTLGCLRIRWGRGVCGVAARDARTQVVPDVAAFPGHIACDAATTSEIVVPVLDAAGAVMAVLDVDSTLPAAFDEVDREALEGMVRLLRERVARPVVGWGEAGGASGG